MLEITTAKLDDDHIYGLAFSDALETEVIFKLLEWREFKALDECLRCGISKTNIEELVWELCVVDDKQTDPKYWSDLNAGIITTVADTIMHLSGASVVNPELMNLQMDEQRLLSQNVIEDLIALICRVFPAYKPEEIYNMKFPQILLRAAQAEKLLLESKQITEPIVFKLREESQDQKSPLDFEEINKGFEQVR